MHTMFIWHLGLVKRCLEWWDEVEVVGLLGNALQVLQYNCSPGCENFLGRCGFCECDKCDLWLVAGLSKEDRLAWGRNEYRKSRYVGNLAVIHPMSHPKTLYHQWTVTINTRRWKHGWLGDGSTFYHQPCTVPGLHQNRDVSWVMKNFFKTSGHVGWTNKNKYYNCACVKIWDHAVWKLTWPWITGELLCYKAHLSPRGSNSCRKKVKSNKLASSEWCWQARGLGN